MADINLKFQYNLNNYNKRTKSMDSKKRVFTVLCIDGGGIRGLVPARILQDIEERTGKPIAELFDLVGGASTGALIASGLTVPSETDPSKPKFSAKEMKDFYLTDGPKIFPEYHFKTIRKLSSNVMYDPKPLDDVLQRCLGDAKIKDSLTHLMIPATDIKNFRPVWINHVKGQKDTSPEGWDSMLARDAVRGATTVPTYFPAKYCSTTPNEDMPNVTHRHALIDGGFFAGTALRRLLTQARKLAPPDAEIVVLHIGTGNIDHSISPEEFNKLGPIGLVTKENGSLLLSLIVHMTGKDVLEDIRNEIGDRLITLDGRINPEDPVNSPSASLDDATEKNLKKLERFAEQIIRDNAADVEKLCEILRNRTIAQEHHEKSLQALKTLTGKLEQQKTVKSLTGVYGKILHFASGIPAEKMEDGDAELKALAEKLTETHKGDLDRIYNVRLDKLENQGKIMGAIKDVGSDFSKSVKKIFLPPEEAGNDNATKEDKKPDSPPPAAAEPRPKKHFPGFGK